MTLEEIFTILTENINANNGTLKLASQTISSSEITDIFDKYLLNEDLIIEKAVPLLSATHVTVTGSGNSLIFFNTEINALKYTVTDGIPSMSVDADAVIKDEDGWTFGRSFPVLKGGYWDGFFNPAKPTEWIQYIFFDDAKFSLSATGLTFSGTLQLIDALNALSTLFNTELVELSGKITLNQGEDGYKVTNDTVVPEMKLIGKIGTIDLSLGSFPVFTLDFSMNSSAYIVTQAGDDKGRPLPAIEIRIESTMPIDGETIGVAIPVGIQSESLTMRAIMPETKDVGISELIALANNENLLALMPTNIPVIYDFVLKDWQLTFDTSQKTPTLVTIQVGTRESFSWSIIPGFITLKSVELWMGMVYLNDTFSPSLTIEGVITLGSGDAAVNFIVSASFPSYVFMGSLDPDTPVDLRGILVYLLGETIGNSLPDTLQLGILNITIDPKNSTYSLETALTTDLKIPFVLTDIVVKTVLFDIKYVAGVATGSISGEFQVGTAEDAPFLFVTAAYNGPQEGWMFSGGLKDGSKIDLKEIIDTYLPADYRAFNPFDISITTLFLSFNQGATPADNSYNFRFGAEWTLDLGLTDPLVIAGLTEISYIPTRTTPYTGFIEGSLNLGNILVKARVDFKDQYNDYTFILNNVFVAKLTHDQGDSIICFNFTTETSLGDLIAWLVTAATGQEITLPAPWNVMNNIKLKDFGFSFNLTKNKIGLTYRPSVNLGFIDIQSITLYYTYYPNDPNQKPLVEIQITDGSFLGGALPLPPAWNVLDPETAPAVPGKGENLFRLEFLGMGQHVSLKNGLSPNSVAEAVDLLKAGFERKGDNVPTTPITGTGLKFNSPSNWLIGTQFVIVDTFAIGIVFFDPDMYGLSLYVDGAKAKVFQGLKFEILYKKVSDTVGVYQVYLKLPDAIRQLDFGAVSVTLPSVKIYIYTNGDFKIDFGFPVNDNFSESFGLQMLPFLGSGGFYFGMLSAQTAQTVPAATNGNFSPVIVFGVGLRVGIGKEINKGILKAGLSIVVQGTLEGTYAQFNYYENTPAQRNDPTYFYILGKIAIVGHVYGSVNFLIISADVDLKVFVGTRIVFESYEPILISFSAGVSVSVKVRINLGLFRISIGLSFSTTIEESFIVGSKQPTPWITDSPHALHFRPLSLRAFDGEDPQPAVPVMNWQPILPDTPVALDIWYIPQFTAATEDADGQKAKAVAMLYLESSMDQPSLKKRVLRNGRSEEEDFAFTKFAKGAFLWVLGAYFNKTDAAMRVDALLEETVSMGNLNDIIRYFSQDDLVAPFTLDNVVDFMANYLKATVVIPPRNADSEDEAIVSVLPILPDLILETPDGEIYFDTDRAAYTYNQEQLARIHRYFQELAVRNEGDAGGEAGSFRNSTDTDSQSLATFLFIDYVSLLAKEACQKGVDRLTALGVTVEEGESVEDLVRKYPHFGISAVELAYSNRTRDLRGGTTLHISRLPYTVKQGDTLESVCARFDIGHGALLRANTFLRQQGTDPCAPQQSLLVEKRSGFGENDTLIPGARIVIPDIQHVTGLGTAARETLLSIANRYRVDVLDLITENIGVPGLFQPGKKILVPFAEAMTVGELIGEMEANADFEQLSGLSANLMLQGLRVPLPGEGSTIGEPEAMYKVSGQQIDASTLSVGQSLTLKLPEPLSWLALGTEGDTELPYTLLEEDLEALGALQRAPLQPNILDLAANPLFEVQPRKFTLSTYTTLQLPVALALANGSNELQDTLDPAIWVFPSNLLALLNGYDALAPKVALLKQVQETKTRAATPEPVADYSWSTKIDLRLTQVHAAEDPAQLMPNVYELQGTDQASLSLLKNLVEYYGKNPETAIIRQIDVLYSKEPAKEGQTEPPSGLKSDGIAHTTMYLLQTNLSSLSNPPQPAVSAKLADEPGTQENLLGMSQIEFLTYVWESAIVGTGGYYLYYRVNGSGAGLPEHLFNGDTDNTVTLTVTYHITDDMLLDFLNSAVIRDPIRIDDEILYIETLEQTVSNVLPAAGETFQSFAKRYRTTVSRIALQNPAALFRANTSLHIPPTGTAVGNGAYLTGGSETLASVAEKHGVSVIALAHANKHVAGLFTEPLTFDTRVEVKVATVPPGNIGFSMRRENPQEIPDIPPAELNLQQLYNLLGYHVAANEEFDASVPGLPVAPGDNTYTPPTDLDRIVRPSAKESTDYVYNRIVPIYPFVKSTAEEPVDTDLPPETENPYRAVGKTAEIDLRWQDIFGNLTSFDNTGGATSLPPQQIGYIDPVIGISLYPSLSASYRIEQSTDGVPTLHITLAFNPTPYVPVEADDESWLQRAVSDQAAYRQIYYQLQQDDMRLTIANSLEGDEPIAAVEATAKETLQQLVTAIYRYLGELMAAEASPYVFHVVKNEDETVEQLATEYGTTPENIRRINPDIPADGHLKEGEVIVIPLVIIPADQEIDTPVSDNNPESLFPLVTTLTLSRNINLVDDNFKDEPSVISSIAVLSPNLQGRGANDNSHSITIQDFAQKLQDAFPELKAASGTPQTGVEADSPAEIWLARFDDSPRGIQFALTNAGNPFYFALLPLANHLLSRDQVKIYPYATGTPIWEMNAVESAFNGVDIEKLAQTFLSAVDTFLQADFAIPAWQVEQTQAAGVAGDDPIKYPYQHIINAKKTLADHIVKHLSTVLEDGNLPDENNVKNAQERLRQELLISLSNAYTIDTILQFNVNVRSPYTDSDGLAPNLFGKVIDPNDSTRKAYAFSTTRFSLQQSNSDTGDASYLTILFNSKKENSVNMESGYFPIELRYDINSLEHHIEKVVGIDAYRSSSWLTFILPFGSDDTQLGDLKIPVPLRAYPTSPSLTAQTFESAKIDAVGDESAADRLQRAKRWDYSYTYDYLRAQQDAIHTDIILNVPSAGLKARLFTDEAQPDLFTALLQFSSAYPDIQRDFNRFLLDPSNPAYGYTTMQSFAWLVKRVADAWGKWAEEKAFYGKVSTQDNYQYLIVEGEKSIDDQQALLITVTPQPGTEFALPEVGITGFHTEIVEDTPGLKSFVYYYPDDQEVRHYLRPEAGRAITQRNIGYRDFNIINQENVWSGISVIRNNVLVPDVPTNPDFIYTTPTIRFVNVLTPLLDPDISINIADYTAAEGKQKLSLYLSNFLKALFVELADETTTRQIKVGIGYSYNIQEGIDSLRTVIPISLTTPYDLPIPGGWQTDACPANPEDITPDDAFVCQLAALVEKWFTANQPATANARFNLDISLFTGLSNTQLPILKLHNLYLDESDIRWN